MDDLRLEIASRALAGMLTGIYHDRPTSQPRPDKLAKDALKFADAMLVEAAKPKTETT